MKLQLAYRLLLALSLLACGKPNPYYCAGANPDNNCAEIDGANDAVQGCTTSAQCTGPKAVCDTGQMTCVQCTMGEASACTGMTPVCGGDETCQPCTSHTQCASNVCLPDGSCGDDSTVAYVDPAGTDNTTCSQAMACTKVATALATGRLYVKFTGTTDEAVTVTDQTVSFLAAPGAKLTRTSTGVILSVMGASTLKIYDLDIIGATSTSTGIGISIPAGGTSTVTLTRATVEQCQYYGISVGAGTLDMFQTTIAQNTGGGVFVTSAQFDLENNIIVSNGSAGSTVGGVLLSQLTSGTRKFAFNTLTNNVGASGTISGVACSLVTQPFTLSDNIVYGNQVANGGTQVGGNNCAWTYSDIGPDTMAGTGNLNMDPMFDSSVRPFHLMSSSPCKDAADPAATLDVDFDGDVRPQGPQRDIGADEVIP